MSELTQADIKWLARVQKALDAQPKKSKVAFYAIGDRDLTAYDVTRLDEISAKERDFGAVVDEIGADFNEELIFKFPVESTAG